MFIENMTSQEVKKEISEGKENVLVMVGAMEQHGPHLPINTDTLSAYAIGHRLAENLGNVLIAPIISLGCSKHHMGFPGTISLSYETYAKLLEDVCISLDKHGFKNIIIVPTHGGNIPPINKYLDAIRSKVKANILFIILDNFDKIVDDVVRKHLGDKLKYHEVHSCHACLHETSFMLKEYPDKVRKDKIERGRIKSFNHKQLLENGDLSVLSPNGILGDPTLASAELGEILEKCNHRRRYKEDQRIT